MPQTQSHFSLVEVEERITKVTDADIGRLINLFKNMGCNRRTNLDEKELLNIVIKKVLEGERKWPTNVEMITFFKNAGRSLIKSEENKKSKSTDKSVEIDEFQKTSSPQDTRELLAMNSNLSPDQDLETEDENKANMLLHEKIISLFKDDKSILCILKKMLEDTKKAMILRICSITEKEYLSSRNKIKYQLKKSYPAGYEHEISS